MSAFELSKNFTLSELRSAAFTPRRLRRIRLLHWGLIPVVVPVVVVLAIPTALILQLENPGNPFFRTSRMGKNGRPFYILKFRTMRKDSDFLFYAELSIPSRKLEWETNRKLKNDPRISGPISQFIRTLGLDELPQIINILKNEMTFVGPRPIDATELACYTPSQRVLYTRVPPGVTGLWQVKGRNTNSLAQRAELDAEYVRKKSFWLDLKILLLTPKSILLGH